MTSKDPLEQAEDVLHEVSQQVQAEMIKSHAEMILLTATARKPMIEGRLLFTAAGQGIEYQTGVIIAVGLTARNWGRILADDANLDFTKYIDPEAEATCVGNDVFAHYLAREILLIQDVPATDRLRREMENFARLNSAHQWARVITHTIALYAELMREILDIRNGDYDARAEES